MYDTKKNPIRKDGYKYYRSKYSYKKQNPTKPQYNKYSRYKSKMTYSKNSSFSTNDYESENSQKKVIKKPELIEVSENSMTINKENNTSSTKTKDTVEDKENVNPNIINNLQNSDSINLNITDFKDVFYIPKKLMNIYNTYSNTQTQINQQEDYTIKNISLSPNIPIRYNNNLTDSSNLNFLINNNYSPQISQFKLYDSQNSIQSLDLNNNYFKTQINNFSFIEKEKENTDILEINVKLSEKETLVFKIRRYDDMFKTVKIFCEINKLDTKLIRPFILYIIRALNSIYGVYNLNLQSEEIRFLKDIKEYFFDGNEGDGENEIEENNGDFYGNEVD